MVAVAFTHLAEGIGWRMAPFVILEVVDTRTHTHTHAASTHTPTHTHAASTHTWTHTDV